MKKLKVSIGIPAYNEKHNIKNVLNSICDQKEKEIVIKEIIVVSDGSTDKTVQLAKSIGDPRIKVIEFTQRRGKPTVLNRIFRIFKGDVFVNMDADTVLNDKLTIEKLVARFRKDKSIGVITGNVQPLPAKTFLEGAINNYIYARNSIFDEYSIGKTAYTPRGFLAYSRNFLKNFSLPEDVLNEDTYSYFYCFGSKYRVIHEKDAIVLYRSAQHIKDHVKQSIRHLAGGAQLYKYFGKETVDKGFNIPKTASIKIMLYQFFKNPLGYILLKVLNTYCYYKSRKVADKIDVKWATIATSKNLAVGVDK